MENPRLRKQFLSSDLSVLLLLALGRIVLHVATNGQYGFHRDELLAINDARYLDWGYVVYPPLTPFVARISLMLWGPSMVGLRLFADVAQAAAMVLTGLMARELGGGRTAQIFAALAAFAAPVSMAEGSMFQYVSFDYLWWVLAAYFTVRLLRSGDARWWPAIGAAVGLGLLTKYTMAFFVAGILCGVVFTDARRFLKSAWFWCGILLAVSICLPNFMWQVHHNFIGLDFLKHIHARDVGRGEAKGFLPDQLWVCTNIVTVPMWLAGLYFCLVARDGKPYRMIGWMYLVPLALFVVARGRGYYLSPAYPMLLAAGCAWGERWLATQSAGRARIIRRSAVRALAVSALVDAALLLPIAPAGSAWWKVADKVNSNFNEEFDWPEMAASAAQIRDSLPPEDRSSWGILTGDAGQAGAIWVYGARYGLPEALSGSNSNWLRGYGNSPPSTLIVIGFPEIVTGAFKSCQVAGHVGNRYGIVNSAIGDYTTIWVCRNLHEPWPLFWQQIQSFG